jgi:hypothetical protein
MTHGSFLGHVFSSLNWEPFTWYTYNHHSHMILDPLTSVLSIPRVHTHVHMKTWEFGGIRCYWYNHKSVGHAWGWWFRLKGISCTWLLLWYARGIICTGMAFRGWRWWLAFSLQGVWWHLLLLPWSLHPFVMSNLHMPKKLIRMDS